MRETCPEINWEKGIELVGDEALYLELLSDYEAIIRKYLMEIRSAIGNSDHETVLMRSHAIKGSSGNLALTCVYETAAALEKAARNNCVDEFPHLFDKLHDAFDRTCKLIAKQLDGS
jgi:two-component system, sensor histidine kinase and response regulator